MEYRVRETSDFDAEAYKKKTRDVEQQRTGRIELDDDPRLEKLSETQRLKLEELRSSSRPETYDELLDLLDAQVRGLNELDKEKELEVFDDDSLPKKKPFYHDIAEIHEQRFGPNKPTMIDAETIDVVPPPVDFRTRPSKGGQVPSRQVESAGRSRKPVSGEPHLRLEATPLSTRVVNEYHSVPVRTAVKASVAPPPELPPPTPEPLAGDFDEDAPSLQHKVLQKRRTFEEVVLYDVDTIYERRRSISREPKSRDSSISFRTAKEKRTNVQETREAQVQDEEDVIPSPTGSPKDRRRKKRKRRKPKVVTYIVTTDESLSNRRLSNKDWSLFVARQHSEAAVVARRQGSQGDSEVERADVIGHESSPTQSGYNEDTLPIRGSRELEQESVAVQEHAVDNSPIVQDSVKQRRQKKRGPKRMTYIVTYDSWPNRKGSPLPIRSNLRGKIDFEKQKQDTEVLDTSTKVTLEAEPVVITKYKALTNIDSNANATLPDFYLNSDFEAVNTAPLADTRVLAEVQQKKPAAGIETAPTTRVTNIYTPPPAQHVREAIVSQPSPEAVKYVLLYKEAPVETDIDAIQVTSGDYENWYDYEMHSKSQRKSQDDMHFIVAAELTDISEKEAYSRREYTLQQEDVNVEVERFQTDIDADYRGYNAVKETFIDDEIEIAQPKFNDRYAEEHELAPQHLDVRISEPIVQATELEIADENEPVIIETIPASIPVEPKSKAITYVVEYTEPYMVRPLGKYTRKYKQRQSQVKIIELPPAAARVEPEIARETAVKVQDTQQGSEELLSLKQIKGKRKLPKEVTYIVNHDNPYIDLPVGKFSRSKKLASIKRESPTVKEPVHSPTSDAVEESVVTSVDTHVPAITTREKGRRRREPKVVTYVINYGDKYIDRPAGKYSRSKHLPAKVKEPKIQCQIIESQDSSQMAEVDRGKGIFRKRRRVPKIATFVVNYDTPYIDRPQGKYKRLGKTFKPSRVLTAQEASIEEPANTANIVRHAEAVSIVPKEKSKSKRRKEPQIVEYVVQHDSLYVDRPRGPYRRQSRKYESRRQQAVASQQLATEYEERLIPTTQMIATDAKSSKRKGKRQPVLVEYVVEYNQPYIDKPVGKYRRKVAGSVSEKKKSGRTDVESKYIDEATVQKIPVNESLPVKTAEFKVKGGRIREQKLRKPSATVTFVVNYDKPIRQEMLEEDKYAGGNISNWNLRHKTTEMNLPETVSTRPEIRAQDVKVVAPDNRKYKFTPAVQLTEDSSRQVYNERSVDLDDGPYNISYAYSEYQGSAEASYETPTTKYNRAISEPYRGTKAYDPEVSRAPRVTATIDIATISPPRTTETRNAVFSSNVQPSVIAYEPKVAAESAEAPVKQVKRKFSDARSSPPQSPKGSRKATYIVTYDPPSKYRNWDIKARKPRKARGKVDIEAKYNANEDLPTLERGRYRGLAQASYTLQERSPEASVVIPESSSLEFPVAMPQDSGVSSGPPPQVVTYKVNYDLPTKRREWDIQVRKTKRSSAVKQKPGKKTKLPQTMTYQVTHDPPRKYRQWDLKTSRGSYSLRKQKLIAEIEMPEVQQYQIKSDAPEANVSSSPASIQEITAFNYNGRESVRRTVDESRMTYTGEVDVEPEELELPSGATSIKMPRGAQLEFRQDLKISGEVKERDADMKFYPAVSIKRDHFQGRASEPVDIRPAAIDYRNYMYNGQQPSDHYCYESLYDSDVDNVPYTEPRSLRVQIDSDYSWRAPEIRRHYRSETPKVSNDYVNRDYEFIRTDIIQHSDDDTRLPPVIAENVETDYPDTSDVEIHAQPRMSFSDRVDYSVTTSDVAWSVEQPSITTSRSIDVTPVIVATESPSQESISAIEVVPSIDVPLSDYQLESTPQSITYTVNYSQPLPHKEWDIKVRKPRAKTSAVKSKPGAKSKANVSKSKLDKVPETVTYHVTYDVKHSKSTPESVGDDADLWVTEKSSSKRVESPKVVLGTAQTRGELDYRGTPEKSLDEWQVSIRTPPPEFQDNRYKFEQTSASVSTGIELPSGIDETNSKLPHSVTYHITYELPKTRKEWDIKMKPRTKSSPKVRAAKDEDTNDREVIGAAKKTEPIEEPIMVTYEVTYGSPRKHKEWDIKVKKPAKKASKVARVSKPEAIRVVPEVEEVAPKVPPGVTEEVIYQVTHESPLPYKQWDISMKKPSSIRKVATESRKPEYLVPSPAKEAKSTLPPVTYVVDHGVPEAYKQWDIKAKKSKSGKKGSKSKRKSSADAPFGLHHYDDTSAYDDTETPTIMIPLRKPDASKEVTMTYVINHDRPSVWKEWDIKVKKPKQKAKSKKEDIYQSQSKEKDVPTTISVRTECKQPEKPEIKVLVEQPTPIVYDTFDEVSPNPPTPPVVNLRHLGATDAKIAYQSRTEVKYDADFEQPTIAFAGEGPTYQAKVDVFDDTAYQPSITISDQYLETNLDDVIAGRGYVEKFKIEMPKSKKEVSKPVIDIPKAQVTVDNSVLVETPEIDVQVQEAEVVIPLPEIVKEKPKYILPNVDVEAKEDQHTVTYKINYDRPTAYREWDFKMRKSKPTKGKAKTNLKLDDDDAVRVTPDIDLEEKSKKTAVVLPHTVTYKVNYGPPTTHKEWDIRTKKGTSKPTTAATKSGKKEASPANDIVGEVNVDRAAEPQSITFLVKYDLPIAKPSKREKGGSRSPAVSPEVDTTRGPKLTSGSDAEVEGPSPNEQTVTTKFEVQTPTERNTKEKSPKKQPQTMTFIVKYNLPIAKIAQVDLPTRQDDLEIQRPDDIDIVPMSEFSEEGEGLPESINVEIPAVEVTKAGRKDSADKLYETVTYVVSYQLPKVALKDGKKLKLRIETPQPEEGQVAETPKIKEGDDVNLALQGPGTYFHVTQPSPEVVTVAPSLGKAPSKKKSTEEIQQVTYCVTYDVIKKKKANKQSDAKPKTDKIKQKSVEQKDDAETLKINANADNVNEIASIEAPKIQIIDSTISVATEHDTVPLNQTLRIIESDIILQSPELELDAEAEQTGYGHVDNFERNVYVGKATGDLIVEVPEMFGDVEYREIKTQPVIEECETISPAPQEFTDNDDYLPEEEIRSSLIVAAFEQNDYDADVQSYTEPIPFGVNITTAESIRSISCMSAGEIVIEHNVAAVKDKKPHEIIPADVTTAAVNEIQPTTCVIDNNTASGVQLTPARAESGEGKSKKVENGAKDEQIEPPPQDGGSVPQPSNVALVEPSPADEQKVEVLKILVPLIQSGTLYRSSSPPPPTKVTYIVKHESPAPNRSSLSPTPERSQPTSAQSEEDLGFSCFGRNSFRKPIKFPETVAKAGTKPVLAVPPSVRSKSDNQCILIKIAGDEAVAEPPPAFEDHKPSTRHFVVVAIDFGTTYSGYAFRFTSDSGESIHIMRQWEGGDPGALDFKTPSTLLLTPDGKFHSFGFTARNFFHDLNPEDAKRWMYFEKFKMALHSNTDLNVDTEITATNGHRCSALLIFSMALRFFKDHALQELSEQSNTPLVDDDIQWIITVPAIWKSPAKQFMRRAAYQAGIASPEYPTQLMISLEPEAASISVRREKFQELISDNPSRMSYMRTRRSLTPGRRSQTPGRRSQTPGRRSQTPERHRRHSEPRTVGAKPNLSRLELVVPEGLSGGVLQVPGSPSQIYADMTVGQEVNVPGTRYMIVDCGGGTVDITVHEIQANDGSLIEIHKATGGPHGSIGVDHEFEKLLVEIFGQDFIEVFKLRRPAGWVDLMMAFESRKRATDPNRPKPLNVSLPFSFTDYHKKIRNCTVDMMINKFGDKGVTWSMQGMLRLTHDAMERLFQPTLSKIVATVDDVLSNPRVIGINYLFLVGGFAESPMLQNALRKAFSHKLKILIPYDVSLAILKGAVSYGCDPSVVTQRKSRLTYGVATQTPFIKGQHPKSKLVVRDGKDWCCDVFDALVLTDQSISVGETVTRHYTLIDPSVGAPPGASISSEIAIFASESRRLQFTTDSGVKRCGTLCLELPGVLSASNAAATESGAPSGELEKKKVNGRDIQLAMTFGNTEITVAAIDTSTGKCIRAAIDFLNK